MVNVNDYLLDNDNEAFEKVIAAKTSQTVCVM